MSADWYFMKKPLPSHVALEQILAHIPVTHDVDALNPNTKQLLSPVVGAMKEILSTTECVVKDAMGWSCRIRAGPGWRGRFHRAG